jgi:hypothetical protein
MAAVMMSSRLLREERGLRRRDDVAGKDELISV